MKKTTLMKSALKKAAVLPEVFLSDSNTSTAVGRMVRAGTARKISPRLYTRNLADEPKDIVVRNLWQIVALLMPGAVVSHRTAFENRPAPDGSVFLSGAYSRQTPLPGITLRQTVGSGPVGTETPYADMPYMQTLYLASRPRAFLENLLPSRRRGLIARTVGREGVEERLAEMLRTGGEEAINHLRDGARTLAPLLGLEEQFQILDGLVGALLRTRTVNLKTPVARARAHGEPYDPARLPLFEALFAALRSGTWPNRPDAAALSPAFQNVAFYDAYFSNYIEGTEFPIEQAMRIVFEGEIPPSRPQDAHDVLGTYRLVASPSEMRRRPATFEELAILLQGRHAAIMEGRPDQLPGRFKERNNQAGATLFVEPELVRGTLRQGYGMYQGLDEPFARALFVMFLVAEVHPFTDGNGRLARVMMNAELLAGEQTRILIPSVFRGEYIGALKRLTNYRDPNGFLRVMATAQEFVSRINFTNLEAARHTLAACNAFQDPDQDVKLRMPDVELRMPDVELRMPPEMKP